MDRERKDLPPRGRLLYLLYWGIHEPLSQGLVVPTLIQLSEEGWDVVLVSYEKPDGWPDRESFLRQERQFRSSGIQWIPLTYHRRPLWAAKLWDVIQGLVVSLGLIWKCPFDLIHTRSFVASVMGAVLRQWTGAKWVYQKDSYFADERVDAGSWRAGSLTDRMVRKLERWLLKRCDGILSQSDADTERLARNQDGVSGQVSILLHRTTVNLRRFPHEIYSQRANGKSEPLQIVYAGSMGGRYRMKEMANFVSVINRHHPEVRLQVYSGITEKDWIQYIQGSGLHSECWSLARIESHRMGAALARHDVGICFLYAGSNVAIGSPTKIPEYWAAGLPVIHSKGMADIDRFTREHRVGVVVQSYDKNTYLQAWNELRELWKDPELSIRCRKLVEREFNLQIAVGQLSTWYSEHILKKNHPI